MSGIREADESQAAGTDEGKECVLGEVQEGRGTRGRAQLGGQGARFAPRCLKSSVCKQFLMK